MTAVAYWQVAAGSLGREYRNEFLRYGLAFVGGDENIRAMGRVRAGDRVLLKQGRTSVVAVGEVIERDGKCGGLDDREWLHDFDGWRLPAYCFVRWHTAPELIPAEGLTRTSICDTAVPTLRDIVERGLQEWPAVAQVEPEPAMPAAMDDQQILSFLVSEGLRPSSAQELTTALQRARLLARYYYDHCEPADVREHETRTFLIVPFLVALGWPEQHIKVELSAGAGRIDIACFSRPYRRDYKGAPNHGDCVLILESKGFQHGLVSAPHQARGYAEHFPACQTLVVSNGYCYKTFDRSSDGTFSDRPSAYLNLLRPMEAYHLDPVNVRGCRDVLRALMPRR